MSRRSRPELRHRTSSEESKDEELLLQRGRELAEAEGACTSVSCTKANAESRKDHRRNINPQMDPFHKDAGAGPSF